MTQPPQLLPMRFLRALTCAVVLSGICSVSLAFAGPDGDLDAVGHTADGVYLDFLPVGKIELPRLFLVRRADGSLGFDAFGSTSGAMRSGRYVAVAETPTQAAADDVLEGTDFEARAPLGAPLEMRIEAGRPGQPDPYTLTILNEGTYLYAVIAPADGGAILIDFSITRHLIFFFLSALVVMLLFIPMARRYTRGVGRTEAPRGILQNLLETMVIFVRDEIAKPNLGAKYQRFLPYLLTAFFFILTANILGLFPWGASATGNLSITAVLAVFTFVLTQLAGTRDYWTHIFWPPGVPTFVKFILIPVEFLGLFTKPFALAIRLFANMSAGHLIILNLIGLIFIIGGLFGSAAGYGTSVVSIAFTVFIYLLKILVSLIQAYVFTVLSALFIGMAAAEHEHDHVDHAHVVAGPQDRTLADSVGYHGGTDAVHQRTVGTEAAISPF
ncbi:F0F1 ATP synthase subunit A [soil metagenome]